MCTGKLISDLQGSTGLGPGAVTSWCWGYRHRPSVCVGAGGFNSGPDALASIVPTEPFPRPLNVTSLAMILKQFSCGCKTSKLGMIIKSGFLFLITPSTSHTTAAGKN